MSFFENVGREIGKGVEEIGKAIDGIGKGENGGKVEGGLRGAIDAVKDVISKSPEENKQDLIKLLAVLSGQHSRPDAGAPRAGQIIEQGGLSKEDVNKGQKAIVDKLSQAPTREDAETELKDVSKAVRIIWTLFEIVEDELQVVDKKRLFVSRDGAKPVLLLPKWKELMEEYRVIIGRSKKTANELQHSIRNLLDNILPIADLDEDVNKYRPKLQEYVKSLKEFDTSGLENGKAILRLREGVEIFYADFKNRADTAEASARQRLEQVDARILQLQQELDRPPELLVKCWQLFGIPTLDLNKLGEQFSKPESVRSVALATAGVIAILPALSVSLMDSAINAISGREVDILGIFSRMAKEKELNNLLNERRQLADKIKQLQEVIDEIKRTQVTFDGLVYRLVAIEQISKMLVVDAQRLETKLSTIIDADEDDDLTPLFTAKTVRGTYEVLHVALTTFVDGLNRGWIKE
ncbi:hypothetical protein CVT24_012224 [Panaeolus cyanescens]|uniref:Uncharacterized protein n=1 Tax=Panaeolus cyanescens TaxID=181874 RepID=A0A409VYT8_9AGAR|nr:hypothetical protein CVT24_012224 [Panaeolus cyanescens]